VKERAARWGSRARPVILSLRRQSVCNFLLIRKSDITCVSCRLQGDAKFSAAYMLLTHSRETIFANTFEAWEYFGHDEVPSVSASGGRPKPKYREAMCLRKRLNGLTSDAKRGGSA
jgi:hypothetical protein